jgi:hypothetical protein
MLCWHDHSVGHSLDLKNNQLQMVFFSDLESYSNKPTSKQRLIWLAIDLFRYERRCRWRIGFSPSEYRSRYFTYNRDLAEEAASLNTRSEGASAVPLKIACRAQIFDTRVEDMTPGVPIRAIYPPGLALDLRPKAFLLSRSNAGTELRAESWSPMPEENSLQFPSFG